MFRKSVLIYAKNRMEKGQNVEKQDQFQKSPQWPIFEFTEGHKNKVSWWDHDLINMN